MDRQQHRAELIKFLRTIQRRNSAIQEIDDSQSLVESGLIDSLAALQIVSYLEEAYKVDFADNAIDPGDLRSVGTILDIIERATAP
jgi:acyl carrier protein